MTRAGAIIFDNLDIPRGRFGQPRGKINDFNYWTLLTDELTCGIIQCMESRERIALVHSATYDHGQFDIQKDMWCQIVLWSAYRFLSTLERSFSIKSVLEFGDTNVNGSANFAINCTPWDLRDSPKMKMFGTLLPALFSFHLENWTTMLSIGASKGYSQCNLRQIFMRNPSFKNVIIASLEVARSAIVLTIPICEYRTPPGLPDDYIGNAIKLCCARMQHLRLEHPGQCIDQMCSDPSEEEMYYRYVQRLVTSGNKYSESSENFRMSVDPRVVGPRLRDCQYESIRARYPSGTRAGYGTTGRYPNNGRFKFSRFQVRHYPQYVPRSKLANSKIIQTLNECNDRSHFM
ncbi:MDV1 SORF3 [Meleagrid alphaherpesvirus 1]|nr:protein SORF3 [Meleagrid alphaherpesvirus 1]AAG45812.1 MDV1 SORF3 [Meleagrid alphaherpesvirus 1]